MVKNWQKPPVWPTTWSELRTGQTGQEPSHWSKTINWSKTIIVVKIDKNNQYDQQMVRSHNTNQTQSNWSGTILLVKKNQLIKSNYLVRNHQHYKKKTNNMVWINNTDWHRSIHLLAVPGAWGPACVPRVAPGRAWWTPGLGATPISWLRLRWHKYGWSCFPARISSMARFLLLSMAWWSLPSLVHAWLVLLVSCAGWRSGALRRLDRLLT